VAATAPKAWIRSWISTVPLLALLLWLPAAAWAQAIRPDIPSTNGTVNATAVSGNTLYIGGNFTMVRGLPRNHLAAIDIPTGSVLAWDPNANGAVHALAATGLTVFAGGAFTTVGGQPRNLLAASSSRCSWRAAQRSGHELRRTVRSRKRLNRIQVSKCNRSQGRKAASAPCPCWTATAART